MGVTASGAAVRTGSSFLGFRSGYFSAEGLFVCDYVIASGNGAASGIDLGVRLPSVTSQWHVRG